MRSRFPIGLRGEYKHPFLNPKKVGSKPKIDFVIKEKIDGNDNIKIAIEVKWLSESQSLLKNCIKDILRLALIADNYTNASCYFIISGKYSHWVSKVENNDKFSYTNKNGKKINLLNIGVPGHNNLRPNAPNSIFADVIKKASSEVDPKTDLPDAIRITYYGMYPEKPRLDDYVSIGWKIKTYKYN